MTETTWLHVNDVSPSRLREILPRLDVITDGDCGSVWGEHHDLIGQCPYPHVLVLSPSFFDIEILKDAGVSFVLTGADWSDVLLTWRWTEDDQCPDRVSFERDSRKTYTGRK